MATQVNSFWRTVAIVLSYLGVNKNCTGYTQLQLHAHSHLKIEKNAITNMCMDYGYLSDYLKGRGLCFLKKKFYARIFEH